MPHHVQQNNFTLEFDGQFFGIPQRVVTWFTEVGRNQNFIDDDHDRPPVRLIRQMLYEMTGVILCSHSFSYSMYRLSVCVIRLVLTETTARVRCVLRWRSKWNAQIRGIPGNYAYYGYYSAQRHEIALASKDECVFFHELSHCGHELVKGGLKDGQDPLQEIIAQLSAQALCRVVCKSGDMYLGSSYKYISDYAGKIKLSPLSACTKVIGEVEKVLNLILKGD